MSNYKTKFTFQERYDEVTKVLIKHPDRLPIICEKNEKSVFGPEIDKNKYLVPNDLTIGQFLYVIRKRLKINHQMSLFLFIKGNIPHTSALMSHMYETYKDKDGFLYITYAFENTFG